MKTLYLVLLLAVPVSAKDINNGRVADNEALAAEIEQRRIDVDAAIIRWEADLNARITKVKSECLYSPSIAGKTCAEAGSYKIGGKTPFRFDPDRTFDKAEKYYEAAMFFKEMAEVEEFAKKRLTKWSTWELIFKTAWMGWTDKEAWADFSMNTPGAKIRAAEERGRRMYEDLRAKAVSQATDYSDDQKIALAACVSAVGFSGYNEKEAEEVKGGTAKAFISARLPWQSFITDFAPKKTGKGVCRDYAAVARDFLREMGFKDKTRVVADAGHALTEVTLKRGGGDKVLLFEPQHNLLARDCLLYEYAP